MIERRMNKNIKERYFVKCFPTTSAYYTLQKGSNMIKGTVSFYGEKNKKIYDAKKKAWRDSDETELVLSIKNPQFTESAIEGVKAFYEGSDRVPKWYEPLVNEGVAPEFINFKTKPEYAPTKVLVLKEDKTRETVDISEVNLWGSEIIMKYNGCYIGSILVLKDGKPFDAFSEVDIDELPFK